MVEPRVTAVIPCFNQGKFLRECLDSLRAQTMPDWVAIVLDDASTDGETPRLCDEAADERVRVIHVPQNLGRALVRNVGIAAATTEAVLSLDADDKLAPTYLERTLAALLTADDVGVAYADYQKFGRESAVMAFEPFAEAALYSRQFIPAGALFRRSAWAKTTGYHADFSIGNEDYDFWLRIVEAGYRGTWIPEPLFLYRIHAASWSTEDAGDDRNYRSRLLILQHHAAGFAKHGATQGFLRDTYWREGRRLTGVGKRWQARAMFARMVRTDPGNWRGWLDVVWP